MHARNFDCPSGRTGVQACFSDPLQGASKIEAANAPWHEIRRARERATRETGEKRSLATLVVRKPSREKPAAQGDHGESSDDESNRAVRAAKIVADVRRKSRQYCPEPQESEKCGGDQAPKA